MVEYAGYSSWRRKQWRLFVSGVKKKRKAPPSVVTGVAILLKSRLPFLQRQSIATAEAWGDTQVLPSSSDTRSRAQELRVLANDFLCPGGCPSKDSIEGLPIEFVIEPRQNEDGCGYCRRLRESGEWGGAAEIVALSNVLRRAISVHHQPPLGSIKHMARYGESETGTELRVLYVGSSHYMAVIPNMVSAVR